MAASLHLKEQEHTQSSAGYPEHCRPPHPLLQVLFWQNTEQIIGCSNYRWRSYKGVKQSHSRQGGKEFNVSISKITNEWRKHSKKDGAQSQNDSGREYPSMLQQTFSALSLDSRSLFRPEQFPRQQTLSTTPSETQPKESHRAKQ